MTISRRHFVRAALGAGLAASTGCGLLIYPERRGQPKGQLDWGVVALDGLGLLLFVVPGIVAFVVDFATGAIYLPPAETQYGLARGKQGEKLAKRDVPRDEISQKRVEELVSQHVGRPVRLAEGQFQTKPLDSVDEYWSAVDQMADDAS